MTSSPDLQVERGPVHGVDRRRQKLRMLAIDDLHDGKVVIHPAVGVGHLEDLAVLAAIRDSGAWPWARRPSGRRSESTDSW